jgi:sugar O-acyltransferase (sialic acid O-acetyltransferase NeuD family)
MPTDLIIVCAGGAAREIAAVAADINRREKEWNVVGFLDDDVSKRGAALERVPVLGPIEAARDYPRARFVIGIANYKAPGTRERIAATLALPPERYATLVHPSASVADSATIGHGTVVAQGVVITSSTRIGDHVLLAHGVLVGHDAVIASYVAIAPGAVISGAVRIEESAYVGAGAVVPQGVVIGKEALVGLGAVLTGDVAAGTTVFGNPARAISRASGGLRRWIP